MATSRVLLLWRGRKETVMVDSCHYNKTHEARCLKRKKFIQVTVLEVQGDFKTCAGS
jgi:hypothetical protein